VSRALLISENQAFVAESVAVLRALGLDVLVQPSLPPGPQAQGCALWIVDNDPGCRAGRRAVQLRAQQPEPRPALVWTGAGIRTGLGLVFDEWPDALLRPPFSLATLGTVLARLERDEGLSPTLDLERIEGPVEAFPPLRVLWSIWKARATGRIELFLDPDELELFIQDGQIVQGRGLSGPLEGLGLVADAGDSFSTLLGKAIAQGVPVDQALDGLALAVGRALLAAVGRLGGMILFEPQVQPDGDAFPLPREVPWILSMAMRQCRSAAQVRQVLEPLLDDVLVAGGEAVEGAQLPAAALRLSKAAAKGQRLGELLGADDGGWLAVDLLLQLGLVTLRLPPEPAPAPAPADRAGATPRSRREGRSEQLTKLLDDRARLRDLDAAGVFGITRSSDLEPRSLAERFRLLSSNYHPDRFARQPDEVLKVVRDIFSLVNEAYDQLKQPAQAEDLRQRLLAREEGRTWSSESDKRRARIHLAEAEAAFRGQKYPLALEAANRGFELHPDDWKLRFLRARLRRLTGQLDAFGLATELLEMQVPDGRARAELLYLLGEALLESDREAAAYKAFEDAVKEFPDHIEARRRLRLRLLRRKGVDEVRKRDEQERQVREADKPPPPPTRSPKR